MSQRRDPRRKHSRPIENRASLTGRTGQATTLFKSPVNPGPAPRKRRSYTKNPTYSWQLREEDQGKRTWKRRRQATPLERAVSQMSVDQFRACLEGRSPDEFEGDRRGDYYERFGDEKIIYGDRTVHPDDVDDMDDEFLQAVIDATRVKVQVEEQKIKEEDAIKEREKFEAEAKAILEKQKLIYDEETKARERGKAYRSNERPPRRYSRRSHRGSLSQRKAYWPRYGRRKSSNPRILFGRPGVRRIRKYSASKERKFKWQVANPGSEGYGSWYREEGVAASNPPARSQIQSPPHSIPRPTQGPSNQSAHTSPARSPLPATPKSKRNSRIPSGNTPKARSSASRASNTPKARASASRASNTPKARLSASRASNTSKARSSASHTSPLGYTSPRGKSPIPLRSPLKQAAPLLSDDMDDEHEDEHHGGPAIDPTLDEGGQNDVPQHNPQGVPQGGRFNFPEVEPDDLPHDYSHDLSYGTSQLGLDHSHLTEASDHDYSRHTDASELDYSHATDASHHDPEEHDPLEGLV